MKSYTDISQSKKLAEILPIETADGFWEYHDKWHSEGDEWEGYEDYPRAEPYLAYTRKENEWEDEKASVPCWSLAALLDALKIFTAPTAFPTKVSTPSLIKTENGYKVTYAGDYTPMLNNESTAENAIDACVEMIIRLNEKGLL